MRGASDGDRYTAVVRPAASDATVSLIRSNPAGAAILVTVDVTAPLSTNHVLSLTALGQRLTVTLNGAVIIDYVDNDVLAYRSPGIVVMRIQLGGTASQAEIRDVQIREALANHAHYGTY